MTQELMLNAAGGTFRERQTDRKTLCETEAKREREEKLFFSLHKDNINSGMMMIPKHN